MVTALGAGYLFAEGAASNFEVLRKCHYEVDISGIDCILVAQDVTIPRWELETVEVYHYNSRVKIASKPNPSDLRIDIMDTVDPIIVSELWSWFNQVCNTDTLQMGLASQYKRTGNIYVYAPDNTLIRTYTASGLWPKNTPTPEQPYSYSGGHEIVTVQMVISCDQIQMATNGIGNSNAPTT